MIRYRKGPILLFPMQIFSNFCHFLSPLLVCPADLTLSLHSLSKMPKNLSLSSLRFGTQNHLLTDLTFENPTLSKTPNYLSLSYQFLGPYTSFWQILSITNYILLVDLAKYNILVLLYSLSLKRNCSLLTSPFRLHMLPRAL